MLPCTGSHKVSGDCLLLPPPPPLLRPETLEGSGESGMPPQLMSAAASASPELKFQ